MSPVLEHRRGGSAVLFVLVVVAHIILISAQVTSKSGMPVLQGRGQGDLVIEIMVETPTKLTARQKEILRELQATETGEECPQSRGFFERIKEAWSDFTD